nr:unnamed protein product [Haemonchus contortus]
MGDADDFQICDNVLACAFLEVSPVWVDVAEDLKVVWVDVVTNDDKSTVNSGRSGNCGGGGTKQFNAGQRDGIVTEDIDESPGVLDGIERAVQ